MPNPWTGKGNPYTRKEVIERLNATLKRREPIIAAGAGTGIDRKSTRLNSSHSQISYAVFCLKKNERPQTDDLAPVTTRRGDRGAGAGQWSWPAGRLAPARPRRCVAQHPRDHWALDRGPRAPA